MTSPELFLIIGGAAMSIGLGMKGHGITSGIFWIGYAIYLGVAAIVWTISGK